MNLYKFFLKNKNVLCFYRCFYPQGLTIENIVGEKQLK